MATVVQTTYPQPSGYPQQTVGYAQQPTVIQVPAPQTTTTSYNTGSSPSVSNKYNKKAGVTTGILQIIAGCLLVLMGIIVLSLGSWYRSGWNIWGGICFYIVTGILGVVSKNQNKCVIIAYMVMSIISSICAFGQMAYDASGAGVSSGLGWFYCSNYNYDYYGYTYAYHDSCSLVSAIVAVHAIAAIVGFGEMIIAIVASAYCCGGVCGSSTPTQTTVVTYAQPAPTGQVTVLTQAAYPPQGSYPQPGAYPAPAPYPQGQAQPPAYTQAPPQQYPPQQAPPQQTPPKQAPPQQTPSEDAYVEIQ